MIRIATVGLLRRLRADADGARAHARETRGQADAAFGEYVRQVWELTARAESAESDASILREQVGEIEAALKQAHTDLAAAEAAPLAGRSVVLLLHFGEVHSVHASVHDAEEHAAAHGADPSGWVPVSARPAHQVTWRMLGTTVSGGESCTP
ncbi:hypothetical protein F9278_30390 [Streptomyces phaeolivaceus]|uniref:Uncharacterized protein n=1 Tax=Streptomyces phaeolivaceus TaxID=2653200 RepID=A0A5P8K9Q4_9ACTN|nr:hypothetical protein [Streptomyces phaeolivaceus]QFQ99750.1 hypothetical protein F9278_30390 [Streptomyces phaeolivaceus]